MKETHESRQASAPVHDQFLERWSPRSFQDRKVETKDLDSVFEAARWAPSCYNEQPWLFVYGQSSADHARILDLLVEGNQTWASSAPVLGIVFARRDFSRNGKPNRWSAFDSGAASFAMALQAHALGLSVHMMGGIHADRTYDALGVSEDEYEAMAGFALGYVGDPSALPEELAAREQLSDRKPREEFVFEGTKS